MHAHSMRNHIQILPHETRCEEPASVTQVTWDAVCTDWDGLSKEPGFNSVGRPVDFVFGFQWTLGAEINKQLQLLFATTLALTLHHNDVIVV